MAEFTSNSPVMLDELAIFTPTVTGTGPFSYLWEFGDGITSTLDTPTHTYSALGTYPVTLTVDSDYGSDMVMHPIEVVGVPPEVMIINPSPVIVGDAISFTAVVTGTGPFDYLWTFNETVTNTEVSPMYTFEMTGTYTVTLTVISDWGVATDSIQVVVITPETVISKVYLPVVRKTP